MVTDWEVFAQFLVSEQTGLPILPAKSLGDFPVMLTRMWALYPAAKSEWSK